MDSRGIALSLVIFWCAAPPAMGQLHKIFPFIHRSDPAVERHIFMRRPELGIEGRRIAILPFGSGQAAEPLPPPFAPFVRQALSQLGTAAALVDVPDPVEAAPEGERARFDDGRRIALALDRSKAAGVDLLADGQIDALFRTAAGGMVIKSSGELWDVERRIPVWSGRITVDWVRRFPLEDCMLRAAIVLVEEWEQKAANR